MNNLRTLCVAALVACSLPLTGWAQAGYSTNWEGHTSTHAGRYLDYVLVTDGTNSTKISSVQQLKDNLYKDMTARKVRVKPGSTVSVTAGYVGEWMHAYAYVDMENDGSFSYSVDATTHKPAADSDLRAFSYYNGFDSNGASSDKHQIGAQTLPSFTAPSTEGTYRMRVKIDWDNIDPAGTSTNFEALGGCIVDFTLNVTNDETPEEYATNYLDSDNSTHGNRYFQSLSLTSNGVVKLTLPVASAIHSPIIYDKTDKVAEVEAGSKLKVNINYNGDWMHTYAYIDLNNDKEFSNEVDAVNHKAADGSELCAFSYYSFGEGDGVNGYNSLGTPLTTGDVAAKPLDYLPEFTAPTTPGTYRMRVKVDWNNIDPKGTARGGANDMRTNGGAFVDFTLKVVAAASSAELPYSIDFTTEPITDPEKFAAWTKNDRNNDGVTWLLNGDKVPGMNIPQKSFNNDDDLVSPAFTLTGGNSYKVHVFTTYADNPDPKAKLSLIAKDATGNETVVKDRVTSPNMVKPEVDDAIVFVPATDGNYQFVLRYVTEGVPPTANVKKFSVAAETLTLKITTPEGYGTYCAPQAYTMPEGLKGTTVTGATPNADGTGGTLTTAWTYTAGSSVPKGTALLLKADEAKEAEFTAQLSADNTTAPTGNYLHGPEAVKDGKTFVDGTDMKYYILSYKEGTETEEVPGEDLGFYWAADGGAAIEFPADGYPYCFLALPASVANQVKGFSFDPHTTGITTVVDGTSQAPAAIYTITGRRVNATSVSGLEKGIYIVGGKKVLVK